MLQTVLFKVIVKLEVVDEIYAVVENIIESDNVTAIGKVFADGDYEGNDFLQIHLTME